MKHKKNQSINPIPDVFVCVGYRDIYDDYDTVDINKVIEGIPTIAIINHIVEQQNRVLYSITDVITQKQQIRDFAKYVSNNAKQKIWKFTRRNKKCCIYDTYGCLMAYGFALNNFKSLDLDDNNIDLCIDEYENVFKLILYCNQKWTDRQVTDEFPQNIIDASIKLDVPIVEFKLHKDFRSQIYKAIHFFKFLELDSYYKQILPHFCNDKNVKCWQEYIGRLFNFYSHSLKGHFVKVNTSNTEDNIFFNQYCVDVENCPDASTINDTLKYFREHFLIYCSNKNYILLNANLLVDKIYQGMRFDIYRTVYEHDIKNKNNKKYNNYPDFSSCIGEDFSEPNLFYCLMIKTFNGIHTKFLTGGT